MRRAAMMEIEADSLAMITAGPLGSRANRAGNGLWQNRGFDGRTEGIPNSVQGWDTVHKAGAGSEKSQVGHAQDIFEDTRKRCANSMR